jgi:hypothetical protein
MTPRDWPVLAAVLLLAAPVAGAPASLPEIRGIVYEGDRNHPAPGVLIALYDAGDFLVDSTYTSDDGRFRLRAPQEKGRFYAVASKGSASGRAAFDYDPAALPGKHVTFVLPSSKKSLLEQAAGFLLSTLGAVFGTVVGLVAGLLFRRKVEEPVAAAAKRDLFLSELRATVEETLAQYPALTPRTHLAEITAGVRRIRQLLDRRTDAEEALHRLDQKEGRRRFRALDANVRKVETLLVGAQGRPSNEQDGKLEAAREVLRVIRDRPLDSEQTP